MAAELRTFLGLKRNGLSQENRLAPLAGAFLRAIRICNCPTFSLLPKLCMSS